MSKRSGENLARTADGSTYNKLQRPEHWPVEPARSIPIADERDLAEDAASDDVSSVIAASKRSTKQKSRDNRRKSKKPDNGCLPLDDDDFSGSENANDVSFAALQYLKSVRAQAEELPVVHVAPNDHEPGKDEHRGYFEDGTYTAAPQHGPELPEDYYDDFEWDDNESEDGAEQEDARHNAAAHLTPCEAYTSALLSRFHQVRTSINDRKLASDFLRDAPEVQLRVSRRLDRYGRLSWKEAMAQKAPATSAIAATIMDSRMNLLGILKQECMQRKQNVPKTTGLWLLALLASIDETTIDSDVVYELRELAKRAIWLRIDFEPRFAEVSKVMGEEAGYIEEEEEGGLKGDSDVAIEDSDPGSKESLKRQGDTEVLEDLPVSESIPDDATRATLDMVVVIIGEVFGQRDLLESRSVVDWPIISDEAPAGAEEGLESLAG